MIIRANKCFHVAIDLNPLDLSEILAELEAVAEQRVDFPKPHLGQLYSTLRAVARTEDLPIISHTEDLNPSEQQEKE